MADKHPRRRVGVSRRAAAPRLEPLEPRVVLAVPTLAASVPLPGASKSWDLSIGALFASPIAQDVDGDGQEEIFLPGGDTNYYAYKYNKATGAYAVDHTYSTGGAGGQFQSTPVLTALPGGVEALFAGDNKGMVWGWDARTGALLPGWPQSVQVRFSGQNTLPDAIFGGLTAADLRGDGQVEILATSIDHAMSVFNSDGSLYWQYNNDDTIFSTPQVADINRDGKMDVVIGGDSSDNAYYSQGGHITVLSYDGRREWVAQTPQVIQSSPTLVDLFNTGYLDVVVGTGNTLSGVGNTVYAYDPNGNPIPGYPFTTNANPAVNATTYTSAAAADLEGTGNLDVVIGDAQGYLHALRPDGSQIWSTNVLSTPGTALWASPIVADVTGAGKPDAIEADGSYVTAIDGATGRPVWNFAFGSPTTGPLSYYYSSPVVGDFRGDGHQEMALVGEARPNGPPGVLSVFNLPDSTLVPPWPSFRKTPGNAAIARSTTLDTDIIQELYQNANGRLASPAEVQGWLAPLQSAGSLLPTIAGIFGGAESITAEINAIYATYLHRAVDPIGLAGYFQQLTAGARLADIEEVVAASAEAFGTVGGNSNQTYVDYLYQAILHRTAQGGEEEGYVNLLNADPAARAQVVTSILLSQEATEGQVRTWYHEYYNADPSPLTLFAAGYDLRHGKSELTVLSNLINSPDYASSQQESSWIRAVYQDLLKRTPSDQEVMGYLQHFEAGATYDSIARAILGSAEYNDNLVGYWYGEYLGRASSQAERAPLVAQLVGGMTRTQAITSIMSSGEYYNDAGGNPSGLVNTIYNDILHNGPDSAGLAYWLSQPVATIQAKLPPALLTSTQYGYNIVRSLYYFTLHRFEWTPADSAAAVAANSPPLTTYAGGDINYVATGGSPAIVQVQLLTSPEYLDNALSKAVWKGFQWHIPFPLDD